MFNLIGTHVLACVASVKKFLGGKEEGASLVEYGLLVALIAVVCIGSITLLGAAINGGFSNLATAITTGFGG
jgi:pilus assembly protein Flp/PilA